MAIVKPIPEGHHTVTPSLVVRDGAQAIEFYRKAFGAKLIEKFDGPDGKLMHAEIQIGDSRVMLGEEDPDRGCMAPASLSGHSGSLCLYVEDSDKTFSLAVRAGAKVEMPLADQFWGDRAGMVSDASGNRWLIATRKKNLTSEQIREAADEFFSSLAKTG